MNNRIGGGKSDVYIIRCFSEMGLVDSEVQKYQRLCTAIKRAKPPWGMLSDLPELKRPGHGDVSTYMLMPRRVFGKWIDEFAVDFPFRVQGALGRGIFSCDRLMVRIEVARMGADPQWPTGLIEVILEGFAPSLVVVHRAEALVGKGVPVDKKSPRGALERVLAKYEINAIPQWAYINGGILEGIFKVDKVPKMEPVETEGVWVKQMGDGVVTYSSEIFLDWDRFEMETARLGNWWRAVGCE